MHPIADDIDDREMKMFRKQKTGVERTFDPLARCQDGLGPDGSLSKIKPPMCGNIAFAMTTWLVTGKTWETQYISLVVSITDECIDYAAETVGEPLSSLQMFFYSHINDMETDKTSKQWVGEYV